MAFWDRFRPRFRAPIDSPGKSFSGPTYRPVDTAILEAFGLAGGSAPRVGRIEALSVPAVQRGRNMLCSIATLPLIQYGPDQQRVENPLLQQLDPDIPNVVTLSQTIEDLVFEGIAWWRIVAFGWDGYPVSVRRLDPGSVSVQPPSAGQTPAPLPSGVDPREGVVYVDGRPVSATQLIRFDSPNPAVLKVGGRAIKRAILLDQAAAMYATDPRPLDYFTASSDAEEISDEEVNEILTQWNAARRRRSTAYVPPSMTYSQVSQPSPAELQLAQLQARASLDIANAFGIDPEDLGVSTTSRTYTNDVDRRRGRINDVLAPIMRAVTDRLSMGDVTKRGYRVAFDLDDFLKSNPTERWNTYKLAVDMGVMSVEEIREKEGLPPGAPTPPPEPAPEPPVSEADPQPDAVDASASVSHTFDDRHRFVDLPLDTFTVDRETRVIEGIALPYKNSTDKYGMSLRFEKGALKFGDPGRVKLLMDHDPTRAIGKAIKLTDSPNGFVARFKVARGAEGDRALELAEDGVLDGLSVGVDFNEAADTIADPRVKGGMLVRRADLREVSLTAMPAFQDARVTHVAASLSDQGAGMPEQTEPEVQAPTTPPAAGGVNLTNDQFAALLGHIKAAQPDAVQGDMMPRTVKLDGRDVTDRFYDRQTVNPTRTFVREPAPYRFDRKGNLTSGSHEFSADLFAALRSDNRDLAAYDRALSFIRAQFDVVTTNVDELNPSGQRPDLYVDQREYQYPIWNAINKGTLNSITPFVFPKFSSAGSLVASHNQGTEPSSGTFVTTSDTVTPVAMSGKAKISREVWDQGGSPQISNLIWRQMQRGWFEALEAAAVTLLDNATPTSLGTFTTGGGTTGQTLAAELRAALALLHYVRGGFTMTEAFAQINLYQALINARDTAGRPLFPATGPTNADGTVATRYGAVNVNGVTFLPAWALAASGTAAASSYLFDRESVYGWASAPEQLTIDRTEVANVYIGIWGYHAEIIRDINGVRELIYDPV